jgi:hypothetical protein
MPPDQQIFSFSTLTMSLNCLLACMIFDEMSGVHVGEGIIYVTSQFSLANFKIL